MCPVPAQPSRHFGPVGSLLLWRGATVRILRSLAQSCLGTLGLLDRSCCNAARILRSLAQPSRDFGPRSGCGAALILIAKEILCRDLDKEVFTRVVTRELAQGSCHGDLL